MATRTLPPQHQDQQPGRQTEMTPQPASEPRDARARKLHNKVALITGGDSGIGRAIAFAFAKEGAHIAITYLNEHDDAEETKRRVEQLDRKCLTFAGDIGDESFCAETVKRVASELGRLDILINNAAEQHPKESLTDISGEQLERTFRTNLFSMFYMTKAALQYLHEGSTIVNTASVTAYRGNPELIDYASTKGAILSFTRSLAAGLAEKNIRVNAVAPGPIWTPLIPASYSADEVKDFGKDTPLGRPGQPEEVAPSYVFLACDDSSYMTGQVLHPNGGTPVGS